MIKENLLMNHRMITAAVTFNVDFATDDEIRDLFFRYFCSWEMVWPNEDMMILAIQTRADLNRDYWNKIWKTTLLDYNPIENYDRHEEYTDVEKAQSQSGTDGETDTYQYPMNSAGEKHTAKGIDHNAASSDQNREMTHTARLHGNIGVTTSQQMIQSERDITMRFAQEYIRDFAELFMLTL